jgi:hypothetical protein
MQWNVHIPITIGLIEQARRLRSVGECTPKLCRERHDGVATTGLRRLIDALASSRKEQTIFVELFQDRKFQENLELASTAGIPRDCKANDTMTELDLHRPSCASSSLSDPIITWKSNA